MSKKLIEEILAETRRWQTRSPSRREIEELHRKLDLLSFQLFPAGAYEISQPTPPKAKCEKEGCERDWREPDGLFNLASTGEEPRWFCLPHSREIWLPDSLGPPGRPGEPRALLAKAKEMAGRWGRFLETLKGEMK